MVGCRELSLAVEDSSLPVDAMRRADATPAQAPSLVDALFMAGPSPPLLFDTRTPPSCRWIEWIDTCVRPACIDVASPVYRRAYDY